MVAFHRGKDTIIKAFDLAGGTVDYSKWCDTCDWTFDRESIDTSNFGSDWRSAIGGYASFNGTMGGKASLGTADGTAIPPHFFYDWTLAPSTKYCVLTIAEGGTAAGNEFVQGQVAFSGYKQSAAIDGVVTWTVNFALASGSVARGTTTAQGSCVGPYGTV